MMWEGKISRGNKENVMFTSNLIRHSTHFKQVFLCVFDKNEMKIVQQWKK